MLSVKRFVISNLCHDKPFTVIIWRFHVVPIVEDKNELYTDSFVEYSKYLPYSSKGTTLLFKPNSNLKLSLTSTCLVEILASKRNKPLCRNCSLRVIIIFRLAMPTTLFTYH